ncbi:hypothetical protein B0T14DRAFT_201573 [Immersiella caudata]|uniref:Uncharacterized protein n=1 Tax=Immersiella caudata TaxID=314043 RepID=A0AA39WPM0_9PEZI|nr:hypothetical protein B0T14DRAFT_201573 [Immersiella caudata]
MRPCLLLIPGASRTNPMHIPPSPHIMASGREDKEPSGQTIWAYDVSDFADLGLTLVEVSPERSWGTDRHTIAPPTAFLRFRHDDTGSYDFVVLLELVRSGNGFETRCSVTTCFRNATLKHVIEQLSFDPDEGAFWSTKAGNGVFNLEMSLRSAGQSKIRIVPEAVPDSPITSISSVTDLSELSISTLEEAEEEAGSEVEEEEHSSPDDNASDTSGDSSMSSSTAQERLLTGPWFEDLSAQDEDPPPLCWWSCPKLRVPELLSPQANADRNHRIIHKTAQTFISPLGTNVHQTKREYFMCQLCRHHFTFREIFRPSTTCPPEQHNFSLREIRFHRFEQLGGTRSPPAEPCMLATICFVCSTCNLHSYLDIFSPRLPSPDLLLISDQERIAASLQAFKESEPERYGSLSPSIERRILTTPLISMQTYLTDTWRRQRRRISWRNKTFQVQFGEACARVFERLGFTVEEDENETKYWALPVWELNGEDEPGPAEREVFFEDALHELVAVMRNIRESRAEFRDTSLQSGFISFDLA